MNALRIQGGRVIDPANAVDEIRDVGICNGRLVSPDQLPADTPRIQAAGRWVVPGLIDMHVHLREPGRTDQETIESATRCAARGGFTSVVSMPNTNPVADNTGTIAFIKQRAAQVACVHVWPTGAITKDLAGEELAPIGSLKRAGVVAITDDGHCVQNNELMRRAIEYAQMFRLPVLDHCQDYNLTADGVMHEGYWSTVLGLRGWPSVGEEVIVARNILLAEVAGGHVHCQHLSSALSVQLIRDAKRRNVKISAEVCPHHFTLTDECLREFDTNFKTNPPLRTAADRAALIEGLADGTIDCIASDHAPHCGYEKEVEFDIAPFGIIGLETELALALRLVHEQKLTPAQLIAKFTVNPAKILGLDRGTLSVGAVADVTIIDPHLEWTYDVNQSESRSRNTPFHNWRFCGKAVMTIVAGKIVWRDTETFPNVQV